MEDIFVYYIKLPDGIPEMVAPGLDGYTIYIDPRMSYEKQVTEYLHAVGHICNKDFQKTDVQEIECEAHTEVKS